uniref:Large ribosomal subunit protein bL36c n=1 Tax=Pedobesia claviformis TaxID=2364088 RepID=A0A386B0V7_9CHLO|nr:ribosomal protein L36 [Pedobesia claviformis]AYC65331.1 ribosomal protein L36 [Pedobesia claviformis]
MKNRTSVKKICKYCRLIRRKGHIRIVCIVPKHKQKQLRRNLGK